MNNVTRTIFILIATLLSPIASAFQPLDDQQLAKITAGSADADLQNLDSLVRIPLYYSKNNIDVDGEIFVLPSSNYNQTSSLQLLDNAQSNLRSLININAVNSPINVLLNLNINVQSTIDRVIQLNSLTSD